MARWKLIFISVAVIALAVSVSASVCAGGFELLNPTVNGLKGHVRVPQKGIVNLCYDVFEYFYSGRGRDYAYVMFTVGRPLRISKAVGRDADNRMTDVKTIQLALERIDVYRGEISGIADERLYHAIEQFQGDYANQQPDGRIDVRGKTIRVLAIEAADEIFLKLQREKSSAEESADDRYNIRDCVNFEAPGMVRDYEVSYSRAPFIVEYPVGTEVTRDEKTLIVLGINEQRKVKQLLRRNPYDLGFLARFTVVPEGPQSVQPLATYLRVNGGIPTLQTKIEPGESPKPVIFSWLTLPARDDVEFRYRLYPDQPEWTPWSTRTSVEYFFIGAGSHTFAVETRFQKGEGQWEEVPVSDYRFILERPFISQPLIYKATSGTVVEPERLPDFANMYTSSKALLVGVADFADQSLSPLPFVRQDITQMEKVLSKHGFQVTTMVGSKTRVELMEALESFLAGLKANDRVLVYFSTHGFQDKVVKSRAYLAAADCDTTKPSLSCISLKDLEDNLARATDLPVRHLLVVLDACSSGLGVISKSPEYKELNVAVEPGAHMITAGMAEQEAEMDVQRQISTFTRFLTEGLDGAADYTEDGIVTLTELLLYTRYNVAKKTNGGQTPMIGRIKGPGEIVFDLRK